MLSPHINIYEKIYGIEFEPQSEHSKFYSVKIALMSPRKYGHPHLFPSARAALSYAKKCKLHNAKVVTRKIAYRYMARMVEVFSGRLVIQNGKWYAANKSNSEYNKQLTYKEVMSSIYESRRKVSI